jgi:RsiW-degrading membrane proteinase PrsW (M82 family)
MPSNPSPSATGAPVRPPPLRRRGSHPILRFGCLTLLLGFFGLCFLFTAFYTGVTFADGPWVFTAATLLATATAVPYALLLLWLDRNEPEPPYLVASAFMWGAVVSTAISLVANTSFGLFALELVGHPALANQMTASFSAPFFEELTKGVALIFLFWLFRKDFDNALDGMLYGALIGLGFAWLENILYYVQASGEGAAGMLKLTYLRGVVNGLSSHATYTGMTGLGFGLLRLARKGLLRWALVPLFWGLAMFAHFLWNTFAGVILGLTAQGSELAAYAIGLPLAVLLLQVPFMILLALTGLASWIQEGRVIRRYLADEAPEIVRPEELARLTPARKRAFHSGLVFFRQGPLRWWRHRRLAHAQVRLAFTRWHHEKDPDVRWPADQDADVAELRAEIFAIRRKLRAAG